MLCNHSVVTSLRSSHNPYPLWSSLRSSTSFLHFASLVAPSQHCEMKVAHGIITTADPSHSSQALIDGRLFFASKQSYPTGVFSVVKYEPKKEEAMRRRRKLEEMGGGGRMYFATEGRDWRGTSYRSIIFSLVSEEKVKAQKKREKQREERRRKRRQKVRMDEN